MNEHSDRNLLSGPAPATRWIQRVLLAAIGIGLAIAAFFFLVFALVAGALIATVVGLRFWWVMRKLRAKARNAEALDGEYTVIERTPIAERLER